MLDARSWRNRHIPAVQREFETLETSSLYFPIYTFRSGSNTWGPLMAGFPPGSDAWSNEAFSFSSGSFSEYRRFLWGLDFTISIYTTAYTPTNAVGSQLDISIYDGDPNINGKLLTNFTKRSLISSITSMEEELCLEQPIEISNGGIFIIPNLRHFKSDGSFDSTVAGYEALLAGLAFNISFVSIPPVKV